MRECYIRQAEGDEPRGPFNDEQLVSLAEAGQITLETQISDESQSNWMAVGDNVELKAVLFPERKKLSFKKGGKEGTFQQLNKPEDATAPEVKVEDMLAAAEGKTVEIKEVERQAEKVAGVAPTILAGLMLLSGIANILPRYPVFIAALTKPNSGSTLMQEPFAIIGGLDIVLAVLLFMGLTSIFPLVRFRAMIGLGYFVFYYWSMGNMYGPIAAVCAGLGLFICTITLNFRVMIASAIVGVGGMGGLAWLAWTIASTAQAAAPAAK